MYLISATRISLAVAISCLILSVGISSHAQTYKLLYQFKPGADGSQPYSSLILDKQGNMYGTTSTDGAYASGTVYRVTPSGKETVLYSFTGLGGDGANPYTLLTGDSAGNLYGTTTYGGNYGGVCGPAGCGTVFKLAPTGKETVLHRFTGVNGDGYSPYQGVIRDAAGNLYGTTAYGGTYGYGTVFEVNATGIFSVLYSFAGNGGDGNTPMAGLVRDTKGNLYGTTAYGGVHGYGTVFKLAP